MRHETLGKEPAGSSLERVKLPSSTGFPRATSKRGVASGAAGRGLRDGPEQGIYAPCVCLGRSDDAINRGSD